MTIETERGVTHLRWKGTLPWKTASHPRSQAAIQTEQLREAFAPLDNWRQKRARQFQMPRATNRPYQPGRLPSPRDSLHLPDFDLLDLDSPYLFARPARG